MNNSNLIEVLCIEGNEVAVSRQGINNCMVNLTQMAKPYGKLVADWLRLKSTQEYLLYRMQNVMGIPITGSDNSERYGNITLGSTYVGQYMESRSLKTRSDENIRSTDSHNAFDPTYGGQIIIVQGGNPQEQGTWCTDFHIALDFIAWLDPTKKDAVYDVFIKFLTGRNVGTLVNDRRLPAPKHRDGFLPLEAALRKYTSLDNLNRIAQKRGVTLGHVKSVLKGNKVSNPILQEIIDCAKINREKGITFPDWRIRKKGIDYNQTLIDLFPVQIEKLNGKEE